MKVMHKIVHQSVEEVKAIKFFEWTVFESIIWIINMLLAKSLSPKILFLISVRVIKLTSGNVAFPAEMSSCKSSHVPSYVMDF